MTCRIVLPDGVPLSVGSLVLLSLVKDVLVQTGLRRQASIWYFDAYFMRKSQL